MTAHASLSIQLMGVALIKVSLVAQCDVHVLMRRIRSGHANFDML